MLKLENIIPITIVILAMGITLFVANHESNSCDIKCHEQYGEKAIGKKGLYESCKCIMEDGTLKYPR